MQHNGKNHNLYLNGNTGEWKICKEYHESDWMYDVKDSFNCNAILPKMYTLHMTNLCNLKCKYCYVGNNTDSSIIQLKGKRSDLETFMKGEVFVFARRLKTTKISFFTRI